MLLTIHFTIKNTFSARWQIFGNLSFRTTKQKRMNDILQQRLSLLITMPVNRISKSSSKLGFISQQTRIDKIELGEEIHRTIFNGRPGHRQFMIRRQLDHGTITMRRRTYYRVRLIQDNIMKSVLSERRNIIVLSTILADNNIISVEIFFVFITLLAMMDQISHFR